MPQKPTLPWQTVAGAVLSIGWLVGLAHAQNVSRVTVGQSVYLPSQSGLTQGFLGGYSTGASGFTPESRQQGVNTLSTVPTTRDILANRGRASGVPSMNTAAGSSAGGSGIQPSGSLFRRRAGGGITTEGYSPRDTSWLGGAYGRRSAISQFAQKNNAGYLQGITGAVQPTITSIGGYGSPNPEITVLSEDKLSTRPAAGGDESLDQRMEQIPLDQLINRHLSSQRDGYIVLGWEHFKAGRYRLACDTFGLAADLAVDDTPVLAGIKWARVFSAVASRQYALAIHELRWFIEPDPKTGEIKDPLCMTRLGGIRGMYARATDYDEQLRNLSQELDRSPENASLRALRACMLWLTEQERGRARFQAEQLAQAQGPGRTWGRLAQLMRMAEISGPLSPDTPVGGNRSASGLYSAPTTAPGL